jgi:tetratricopeptide (TPR) repeat protein/GTPase SAR1 family protein
MPKQAREDLYERGLTFASVVESALDHIKKRDWEGLSQSPLAAPYLTYSSFNKHEDSPRARGFAVHQLLKDCVDRLRKPEKYAERYKILLRAFYFENKSRTQTLDAYATDRSYTPQTFNTDRHRAIQELSDVLFESLKPALRLESPPRERNLLVGRSQLLDECQRRLKAGKAVLITGAGGVGKTTFASHAAHDWKDGQLFWYSVRPGFNDYLHNFLFSLGHFLRELKEPLLLSSLMAHAQSARSIELIEVASVIRGSFDRLSKRQITPLIVIDEYDLLKDTSSANIHQVIEQLQGHTPMLIVGQKASFPTEDYLVLESFSYQITTDFLYEHGVELLDEVRHELWEATRGNARLLQLFVALYHLDHAARNNIASIIRQLQRAPPIKFMLSRIVARLPEAERAILMDLSVYRNWAPVDIWQPDPSNGAWPTLEKQQLIELDKEGGVSLRAVYRKVILGEVLRDKRKELHKRAAAALISHGVLLEAAHHMMKSGLLLQAFQLWKDNRDALLNQGQASNAVALLEKLYRRMQSNASALNNTVLRSVLNESARLKHLTDEPQAALLDLRVELASTPILEFERHSLEGEILVKLGDYPNAEQAYARVLEIAERFGQLHISNLYRGLASLRLRAGEIKMALREILKSRLHNSRIEGEVLDSLSEYEQALLRLVEALDIAENIADKKGVAEICTAISGIHARFGNIADAIRYQERADKNLEQMGLTHELNRYKINWAFIYILNEEYDKAKTAAQSALDHFESEKHDPLSYPGTLLHCALAEACAHLGQLDEAEQHVRWANTNEERIVDPDINRIYGEILLARGQPKHALAYVESSLQIAQQNEDQYLAAYGWRTMAYIHFALGDADESDQCWSRATSIFRAIGLEWEARRKPSPGQSR